MRTILLASTDPCFNLAAEEYFLYHSTEEIRMLWRNDRSVIIGKNQNTWAEVNIPYTEKNGIRVVRRLSGGGAVFHDPGNVNYTFITAYAEGTGIDFARFTAPILQVLSDLGIEAALGGRNDILAGGRKISGNAQAVIRRPDGTARQLHHGTILFGADLTALTDALIVHPLKIETKGIQSVRSRVANLKELPGFPQDMTVTGFIDLLAEKLGQGSPVTGLAEAETEAIRTLAREKYETWQWNFGASSRHTAEYTARFPYGTVTAACDVQSGTVTAARITGDFFGTAPVTELEAALTGARLHRKALTEKMQTAPRPVGEYIAGAAAEEIADLILGCYEPADG